MVCVRVSCDTGPLKNCFACSFVYRWLEIHFDRRHCMELSTICTVFEFLCIYFDWMHTYKYIEKELIICEMNKMRANGDIFFSSKSFAPIHVHTSDSTMEMRTMHAHSHTHRLSPRSILSLFQYGRQTMTVSLWRWNIFLFLFAIAVAYDWRCSGECVAFEFDGKYLDEFYALFC